MQGKGAVTFANASIPVHPCEKKQNYQVSLFIKAKDNSKSDEDTMSKIQESIGEIF